MGSGVRAVGTHMRPYRNHPIHSRAVPQIRNPIHAMYGAITQLAGGTLDPAAAAVELATLSHGVSVMIDITNDMLDAEALRLGRLKVTPAPIDVRSVLTGCTGVHRGVAVTLDVAKDVPDVITADGLRLRQVRVRSLRAQCCRHFHD
jgi:two-component system sensor histidine kinase EvgS